LRYRSRVRVALLLLAVAGCRAPFVQIDGVVALNDECIAVPGGPPIQKGLLDISFDATGATPYTAALEVTAETTDITFNTVEVYFTSDLGPALQGPPTFNTPISPETKRVTTIGATSLNPIVFADVITAADAAVLQGQPFIQDSLANGPTARARINVFMTITGVTLDGTEVRSNELPLPMELCQGCLIPQCPAGQQVVTDSCHLGQDDGQGICL
jgi:hypothetical protein